MARIEMTEYKGIENTFVFPECPYAGYQYLFPPFGKDNDTGSHGVVCEHTYGHQYCSSLNQWGECPFDQERKK